MKLGILLGIPLSIAFAGNASAAETIDPPVAPDGGVKVSLFASEPEICTPIGATIDSHGRLMVVESNSHFRPKKYVGPATDRILIFEDTTGAGKADKITTFYEGQNFLMNPVADRDGSILVSSRTEIFRLIDEGGGAPPRKISLANLKTTDDYPHNGLHGLAVDRDGNIYFAIGENHAMFWTLAGADGRQLTDPNGSGSIFRMDRDGHGLIRLAHGFWNPFGMGFDPAGNLWAVDNDPDGRPPSRLIHVLPGGDYGFEFRYGRTGVHPLQAWDGELPATLGMVSGVGEAPVAVIWHDGALYVSSWRDHQVECYHLTPRGASYTASMTPLVHGGENFRPTGLAFAPDGSLFVNDWASGSYSVNGKGRIWKLTLPKTTHSDADFKLTPAMERAAKLRQSDNVPELLAALDDVDPATAQAAQFGLSRLPQAEKIEWSSLASSGQRIGLLAALLQRGSDVRALVGPALKDPNDRVRQMAVRAITEQGIKEAKGDLAALLKASDPLSPRLLGMTVAAMNLLDGDPAAKIDSSKINGVLLDRIKSPEADDASKATALGMLQSGHPPISFDLIATLLKAPSAHLQLQAVRYLCADTSPARFAMLAQTAADPHGDVNVRAEAIDGLSDDAAAQARLLLQLAGDANAALRHEALRSLRPIGMTLAETQKQELAKIEQEYPSDAALVQRIFGHLPANRPPESDIAAWQKVVDQAPGDPAAGRRIFFHPAAAGCYKCHMIEGRGRAIGPDLTMIGHSQTTQHVLESILDPSREIAPLFTMWHITTRSGQTIDGMLLRRDGQSMEVYIDASGVEMKVPEKTIIDRKIRKESLMPNGLVQSLTDQELRDVVAMLMQKR